MRRKLLSVVLCVCMMMTMAPFAFAEGEDVVATVNGTGYTSFADAVNAATEGQTVTLEQNVTLSQQITINHNITIDLNQKSITGGVSATMFEIQSSSSATIENGTINANANGRAINAYGTVSLKNVKINGLAKTKSLLQVQPGADVTIDKDSKLNAQTSSKNDYPAVFLGVDNGPADKLQSLHIYGSITSLNTSAIQGNGTDRSISHINIYDGAEIKSNKLAIYLPQPCEVNMTGGTVEGYCGIGMKSGTLNLSGGIVNGTRNDTDISDQHSSTNGINYDGSAILIDSYIGYAGQVKINISGDATVKSNYSTAIREIGNNASQTNVVAVTVTGGKVLSGTSKDAIQMREASVSTVSLTGGTFSSDVSQYCAKNYYAEKNEDNTYTVKSMKDIAVAQIGDTYYKTLADAVTNANADNTITLLKDATVSSTIKLVNKSCKIDLNGKKIIGQDGEFGCRVFSVGNNASLELCGTGIVTTAAKNKETVFPYNSSVIVVDSRPTSDKGNAFLTIGQDIQVIAPVSNGVSIFGCNDTSAKPTVVVNGIVKTTSDRAAAVICNGLYGNLDITIGANAYVYSEKSYAIYFPAAGTLTINGGSIIGDGGIEAKSGATEISVTGNPVITATGTPHHEVNNDGSSTEGYAIAVVNNKNYSGHATVSIGSGYYKGLIDIVNDQEDAESGAITITGGYFTSDPTSYLANDRYSVPSDKDGYTYMVSNTAPTTPSIFVKDQTETTVDEKITEANAAKINAVINKANVDGTAEAVSSSGKDAIVSSANVSTTDNDDKITIDVKVTVSATAANLTDDSSASTLTFTAIPVATVSVNGEQKATDISVPNDYLNGKKITVKLPLPDRFTPQQIKHICSDGSEEYFLPTQKRGAKIFTIEDGCAVFTITKFSTFEVSGTQTYVEPSHSSSSGTTTSYNVNVNAATNGAVAADKKTAAKGATVTVTASPSKGYVVDAVKVVDKDGKDVAVTEKDGKYVFTMPGSAVTVTGSFKAETPAPVALPFTDVKSGNWFYDAVKYAYEQGLMTGTSATTFAPNGTMNRAMIVTVLYRLEKSPAVTGASKFTDVPAGQWYSDAVTWAAANKIVNGYDETTFGPMNAVTREQMAAILFRYEQVKGLENVTLEENLNRFPDQNKISAYAIHALQWAVGQKIINGNADGTLAPTGTATRAQVAQIFTNLLNK